MLTKSGLMLGLGETRDEVMQVMDDLRAANVDMLTLGQYLQPTRQHAEVLPLRAARRVRRPKTGCVGQRISHRGSASPLTRSSHHAGEEFKKLQTARLAMMMQ